MTTYVGTARNIPSTPPSAPPTKIAKITAIGFTPIASPKTFGPKIEPSNCCNKNINSNTGIVIAGLYKNTSIPTGIAPMNGPTYGMIFVSPIITANINLYLIPKIKNPRYDNNPIIIESTTFPMINLSNVFVTVLQNSKNLSAFSFLTNDKITFFIYAPKFSLSTKMQNEIIIPSNPLISADVKLAMFPSKFTTAPSFAMNSDIAFDISSPKSISEFKLKFKPALSINVCALSIFAGKLFLNSTIESSIAGTKYTPARQIKLIAIKYTIVTDIHLIILLGLPFVNKFAKSVSIKLTDEFKKGT